MSVFKITIDQSDDSVSLEAFPTKKEARQQGNGGHIIAGVEDLVNQPLFTGPILVAIYNKVAEKPVQKFADREAATRRTWAALEASAPKASELAMAASASAAKAKAEGKAPKAPKKAKDASSEPGKRAVLAERVFEVVKGAVNPFRVGTKAFKRFELFEKNAGKTYAELKALGLTSGNINYMIQRGGAAVKAK